MNIIYVAPQVSLRDRVARRSALRRLGHAVESFDRPVSALVRRTNLELVLLDASAAAEPAYHFARDLARFSVPAPVVVVLSGADVSRMSVGWWAQDFVLNDSSPAELSARINRVQAKWSADRSPAQLRNGNMVLAASELVSADGSSRVGLSRLEHSVLTLFFTHPGTVLSREFLAAQAWKGIFDRELPSPRGVDILVCRLRR
ncbi:MAG: response regulator transcription factor, partial [Pseudonocardiales bacterium]|nr:response regulator transcription factor [Pseudonocardiales bacterium]